MELKKLSNEELLSKIKALVDQERELLLEILEHLREIDSRKLYLEIGYSSLWAYCTGALKYSEASAQRRIEAMRALRDTPMLAEKIESGALSLSNVAKAQTVMRRVQAETKKAGAEKKLGRDEKLELFLQLENKSQKEAEVILAGRFPEDVKRPETVRPLSREFSELKLSVPSEVLAKLERVKELLSHKNPNASWAETLEMMADFVIAKKDLTKASAKKATEELAASAAKVTPPQRRSIPTATRRAVWQKAQGACEYTDAKSGRRCGSRHQVEIEHDVQPRALGGSDDIRNLKLFCRSHNQMAARDATLI